jgi:hypothetical protein
MNTQRVCVAGYARPSDLFGRGAGVGEMAQGPALQFCISTKPEQARPPCCAVAAMLRERDCRPPPHSFVHAVHEPNAVTVQSTGAGVGFAVGVCVGCGVGFGVGSGVGQACSLQTRVSAECGQAVPPNVGSTVARLRFCEPTPHDLVHAGHAPKPATEQSVAQAKRLQSRASSGCGHALPPLAGCTKVRRRVCEPVPQDLVHAVHEDHWLITQSTAHGAALQVRVSAECGHALPPTWVF